MRRMNELETRVNSNGYSPQTCAYIQSNSNFNSDIRKYRMTYERAGQYFRAMLMDTAFFPLVDLREVDRMGLRLPDKISPTFAEFLDENVDRLQLFDKPVRAECYGVMLSPIPRRNAILYRQEALE